MNIYQASLISFVTALAGRRLCINEIHDLSDLVKAYHEPSQVSADSIANLLDAIKADRKIEAIKEHRMMTGYGLKESKDEIEKHWPK